MRLASILFALAAACGHSRPAEPTAPAGPPKSLYDRLGGTPAITAVVEEFVTTTGNDPRISQFFINADIPRLKKLMVEQICHDTGGPCEYTGKTMKESHATMHVTAAAFDAFIDDLTKTLAKLNVPAPETREVLAAFNGMRADVVTR
ncbi:MAG: group 1 truncated hemoglobin [Kofleriaceae bacterium]